MKTVSMVKRLFVGLGVVGLAVDCRPSVQSTTSNFSVGGSTFPFKKGFPVCNQASSAAAFGASRGWGRRHAGCDVYTSYREMIYAIEDGTVVEGEYDFYCRTNAIEVNHGGRIVRYTEISPGSAQALGIRAGSAVRQGQAIARVGQVACASVPPMLHFEMYSGAASGGLTNYLRPPYMRRNDLVNPTEFLFSTKSRPAGTVMNGNDGSQNEHEDQVDCTEATADGTICATAKIPVYSEEGETIGNTNPGEPVCLQAKRNAKGHERVYFPRPPAGYGWVVNTDTQRNLCRKAGGASSPSQSQSGFGTASSSGSVINCTESNAPLKICAPSNVPVYGSNGAQIGVAKPGEPVCSYNVKDGQGRMKLHFPLPPVGAGWVSNPEQNVCRR